MGLCFSIFIPDSSIAYGWREPCHLFFYLDGKFSWASRSLHRAYWLDLRGTMKARWSEHEAHENLPFKQKKRLWKVTKIFRYYELIGGKRKVKNGFTFAESPHSACTLICRKWIRIWKTSAVQKRRQWAPQSIGRQVSNSTEWYAPYTANREAMGCLMLCT